MEKFKMYIDGQFVDAVSGKTYESEDPYLRQPWAVLPDGDEEDVDRAVRAAKKAFESGPWPQMNGRERAKLMRRWAELVRENAETLSIAECRDIGKLRVEVAGLVQYVADQIDYFASWADKIYGEVVPGLSNSVFSFTLREPLGVIAAITAWNTPMQMFSQKTAPALATGNTVVLKPPAIASNSSLILGMLAEKAGFPAGVVNVLTGKKVGPALVNHPGIAKVTLTGGEEIGRIVGRDAGHNIKDVCLELGGKSPNIVFEDARREHSLNGALTVYGSAGQSCVCGSRLLLQESIADEFIEQLVERARKIKMGNPLDIKTQLSPVISQEQLEKVKGFVDIAVKEGARIAVGGKQPDDPELKKCGLFFEPTVLVDVDNKMTVAQEEIFGPVLSVIKFKDEEEAVQIANDSRFGLAAGIWTQNLQRAHRVAKRLQAGLVWVNNYRTVFYSTPFGGYKDSGLGRENGIDVLREFTQPKTVMIELSDATKNPFVLS